jgi:uncharacterized protein (DUF697 family)
MARRRTTIGHDPLAAEPDAGDRSATRRTVANDKAQLPDRHFKEPATMTEATAHSEPSENETKAMAIVRSHLGWSAGAGLLPLPGLDIAAIVAVQVNMLSQMAAVYNVPFKSDLVKTLVTALVSSGGGVMLGGAAASMVKSVPIVGSIAGMLSMPAFAAASTWATGKVFIRQFESGGTFLDFDPAKARAYYSEHFTSAKS